MTTKSDTLSVLTLPRLSSKLETLAEHIARFSEEFGVTRDENFAKRVAAIACVNGVLLGNQIADAASELEAILEEESLPTKEEVGEIEGMFLEFFRLGTDWVQSIQGILVVGWAAAADNCVGLDAKTALRLQVLHGIRNGLVVARVLPETAAQIKKLSDFGAEFFRIPGQGFFLGNNGADN